MKRTAYEASELEAARTSSVSKYFNPVVGQHDEIKGKRDKFDNPMGACYDLGKDGAFSEFTVLIGSFYTTSPLPIAALKKKGFEVIETLSYSEFIKKLPGCDVAMFVSGCACDWKEVSAKEWNKQLLTFHHSGKGIWAFSDNEPYFVHANAFLTPSFSLKMIGNTPGNKQLSLSDSALDPPTQCFKRHVITTGIKTLYEGVTISYMTPCDASQTKEKKYPYAPFKVLAQSSDGEPVSCFLDNEFTEQSHGRMLVDGGFTKLYYSWDDAGTARYVVNGVIWLLGLEKKATSKKGGKKSEGRGKWVWEWHNGSEWAPFNVEDAKMLEEKKTAEVDVFTTKKLSFNLKHGTAYKFDLSGKMTQTNTATSHITKIRRRAANEGEEEIAVGKEDDKEEAEEAEEAEESKKTKKAKTKATEEREKWVWQWRQDKKWSYYHVSDAKLLEAKRNAGKLSFKTRNLSFNKTHDTLYEFDLEGFTQTNTATGTKTDIRRRKAKEGEEEHVVD